MRSWFFAAAISACAGAQAAPPETAEIVYELLRNGSAVAEIVQRFEQDGKRYQIAETWKGRGLLALRGEIQRKSTGAVGPEGLRPLEFEDQRSGRETVREKFDPNSPLQDRLSFVWNFAFAPPRQPVALDISDGRHAARSVYASAGRERVKTPAGEFDAIKLVKHRDGPEDRGTEIWLAAERHLLPVRLLILEKDGTRLDQVATRIAAP